MNQTSKEQVDKLLDDIAAIKSVIRENQPLIKQLLLPVHFRIISFISGFGISGIAMTYYFLLKQYGTYPAIPENLRTGLLIVIAVLLLTVWILKGVLWVKSVHSVNRELTFGQMMKNLYSDQILHTWIPITLLIAFFCFYFIRTDTPEHIVPLLAFGVGIVYNIIGGMTRIRIYLFTGYWMIITGILTVLFTQLSVLIWLTVSMGLGLILFGFISKPSKTVEKS